MDHPHELRILDHPHLHLADVILQLLPVGGGRPTAGNELLHLAALHLADVIIMLR